jgi:hypothetical protein
MSTPSMLKFRASIFAAVVAFATLTPASHAQDAGIRARVNVPFGFQTGSQHYAPGAYTIEMENEHTLMISGAAHSSMALMSVDDKAQPAKRGTAVFHKYGDQHFLSEITVVGTGRYLHPTPSRTESKLRRAQKNSAGVELSLLQGIR